MRVHVREREIGISHLKDIQDLVGDRHDPYDGDEEPHGTVTSWHPSPKQQQLYVTTPTQILTKSKNAFITRRKRRTEQSDSEERDGDRRRKMSRESNMLKYALMNLRPGFAGRP